MNVLASGRAALLAELRRLGAALREVPLWALLGAFAALLALATQAPLDYRIEVGREEGYGSDRPMLAGFHAPELAADGTTTLRWTTEESAIRLPGLGGRALLLTLRLLPVNQELAERGPAQLDLWLNGQPLGALRIRPQSGGRYIVPLPALPATADHTLIVRSATHSPAGDARALGTPLDALHITSAAGPWLPPLRHDAAWLGAALLLWLALRRIGLAPQAALWLLGPAAALAALAALLDPPRFAFGSGTALIMGGLGLLLGLLLAGAPAALLLLGLLLALPGLALLLAASGAPAYLLGATLASAGLACALAGWLRPPLGRLYRQVAGPLPAAARRGLLLLSLVVLLTHYGGKIYPDSMWGDIGFHSNRYTEVLGGRVLLISRNRGVDFPYPPALYLLLAPFSLAGFDKRVLLQLGGALLDAASPWLVYAIAVNIGRTENQEPRTEKRDGTVGSWFLALGSSAAWRGLAAAALYSLSAATLMTTWWNFSTHIFTQFTHLLLITVLVGWQSAVGSWQSAVGVPTANCRLPTAWALGGLFALQSLVYLGHFGFWMNTSLLGGLGLLLVLIGVLRRRAGLGQFWALLGVFVAAEAFATLFFYSGYSGLFLAQAQATASGGLTGLANRPATDRAILWNTLWGAGFRTHFGFFPVPLALVGLGLLWRGARTPAARSTAALMASTFLIALLFAALPFLSGSTLSTRWLMFAAWAIAVGAALAAQRLWRAGRAGRWLVLAMGCYVGWVTAVMWLGALAWRIRPPEPF